MTAEAPRDPFGHLAAAYEKMLERVHQALERAGQDTIPSLRRSVEQAREKAVELGELTREEAEKVAGYVERDMRDAATFLSESRQELADWLKFDLHLIESRLLEMFASVADRTRVELSALAEQARQAAFYRTGEVTGPGTLVCRWCGAAMHFHKAGHIPPCPTCHSVEFRRTAAEPDLGDED
jgi:rubrerythrin